MLNRRGWISLVIAIGVLLYSASLVPAQSIFATLTGTVADSSGAVVPGAAITLTNVGSRDVRKTVSNQDGYYTFASIPTGTYNLLVEAKGFQSFEETGIAFTGAEKRNVNSILQIGTAATEVHVVGVADIVAPVDSGEKSSTLTEKQLQDFSAVGRNAAEFIKVMPGFAIAGTGTENRAGFTGEVIGINGNGDGGSQSALNGAFSASGLPINTLDITSDGAHVSDPGCNCATPVNPNTDMIQEFKVLTSNFSAENSKGPAVISSVSKQGGRNFHGEAYFYARDYALNANDWVNNELTIAKPQNKYFFPGGNIGGPVLIPGTNFNKKRDKLFFFTGYEYYYQTLDTGVISATVPTAGMLAGNFSPAELAKIATSGSSPKDSTGGAPGSVNTSLYPGGIIPLTSIDKSGLALLNLYPKPNASPDATGGYNYVDDVAFNQNSWQWLTRADYSVSDNTKLFVRYNLQKEVQQFPVGLWWRNGGQVPYPTPILGKNQSQSVSASLTHVFSPSLTNEFVFSYTYIDFPNTFQDPTKVERTTVGYGYKGIYKNGVNQIPALNSWGGEMATMFNPGGFEVGGSKGLFADKYLPSFSDNISKVWGTHTMKFGVFYEFVINDQPSNGYSNGQIVEAPWGGNSTGNAYADLLTGIVAQYSEQNKNHLNNEAYNTIEFFAQDSWKINKRLTLELGLRASHLGPWYDRQGFGFAAWVPSTYSPAAPATAYPGFEWNKQNSNIPLSGFNSQALVVAPRFGLAYDLFGTGNTVLRGGWGLFYYHNAQFTTGLDAPEGVQAVNSIGPYTLAQIDALNPGNVAISTAGVNPKDNATPKTQSYSFTISQRIPGTSSLLEVAYVGNQSSNQLNTGLIGTNVNAIPAGTFLKYPTDPNQLDSGGPIFNGYRPFPTYTDLGIVNHNLYSNYNAFQVTWVRQKGRYDFQVNYTYGKALGIVGSDQLNLRNDYGPMPFDRRHVFNAAYSIELPNPVQPQGNVLAKGVANGWQFSGITQFQGGVNLAGNGPNAATSSAFNLQTNGAQLANGYNITNLTITGSPDVPIQPLVTCNPNSNLKANQHVNPSCYALPTQPGQNGPTVGPEVFGPAFFNSDLSLFKNFRISESKKLQFRFSAYNFLNHPLDSFRSGSSNLTLNFKEAVAGDPSTISQTNPTFGTTTEKQGHRIIQLALKFYF
jgi:hypothetical protein